jgi:hypothetical protein
MHYKHLQFLVAGLAAPVHVAAAGVVVLLGRFATAFGYYSSAGKRAFGAWFVSKHVRFAHSLTRVYNWFFN